MSNVTPAGFGLGLRGSESDRAESEARHSVSTVSWSRTSNIFVSPVNFKSELHHDARRRLTQWPRQPSDRDWQVTVSVRYSVVTE
jgi:hypothetical protein